MRGLFITFEGSEGSGKSTQVRLLAAYLRLRGKKVLHIREPGGTRIGESIRKILLHVKNTNMSLLCEMFLYMAARAQLIDEVITSALKEGKIVICDRFLDSTVAYQGYGGRLGLGDIRTTGRIATRGVSPRLTFVFDIEPKKGLLRTGKVKDRIERRSAAYHARVRAGYRAIARRNPRRVIVIDANGTRAEIQEQIQAYIRRCIKQW